MSEIDKKELDNSLLYQKHIISGIQLLENRRDKYLSHRLEFLNEYCVPIQERIDEIKDEIKHYENMRDTQNQVIENQAEILQLKKQVKEYRHTGQYFEQKLDDYEQAISSLEDHIQAYGDIIEDKRMRVAGLAASLTDKNIKSQRNNSQIFSQRKQSQYFLRNKKSKQSNNLFHADTPSQSQNFQKKQSTLLPKILKHRKPPSKYYIFSKQNKYKALLGHNKSLNPSILNDSNQNLLLSSSMNNPEGNMEDRTLKKELSEKDIQQLIKQFDKTQSLFRECFERKKLTIQKSVTQLQSKLITNKQTFLIICQAIGGGPQIDKSMQMNSLMHGSSKISYDDFLQLTPDQLMTIFISFGWLNRRIYAQFTNKRRKIIEQTHTKKK